MIRTEKKKVYNKNTRKKIKKIKEGKFVRKICVKKEKEKAKELINMYK